MSGSGFNMRKRHFDKQAGLCHWCRLPMILEKGDGSARHHPRFCTIDHLIDRWDAKTRAQPVAACFACNNKRNTKKLRSLPREVVHARCNPPQGAST